MTDASCSIVSWSESGDSARLRLPAKLNLFLEISGRRDDGYHELTTLMIPIDFCDEIQVVESPDGVDQLEVVGCDAGPEDENLVVRALRLMREYGAIPALRIRLDKRVPPGAGLGGGSSDAAGMLRFLDERYQLGRDRDLMEDAARLGSDVPFFLGAGPAVATGRGEIVTPFDGTLFGGDDVFFALLLPDVHSSSVSAYRGVTLPLTSPDGPISFDPRLFRMSRTWVPALFNRLEDAVLGSQPELQSLAHWLDTRVAGRWRMTGSGSAFYVVCPSESEASSIIGEAENALGIRGRVVRALSRGPHDQ